jgi:hypothetical protein
MGAGDAFAVTSCRKDSIPSVLSARLGLQAEATSDASNTNELAALEECKFPGIS